MSAWRGIIGIDIGIGIFEKNDTDTVHVQYIHVHVDEWWMMNDWSMTN